MASLAAGWGDTLEEANSVPAEENKDVTKVSEKLAEQKLEQTSQDEDDALPVKTFSGIHPADADAEVDIQPSKGIDLSGIYKGGKSFAELGISPELQNGVLSMGFSAPSKIQAQAIPVILSPSFPNLIAQAHHGSGKTAAFSLGILSRVDPAKAVCQAIVVCNVRELAIQVCEVINTIGKFSKIKAVLAIQGSDRARVTSQICVGTAGSLLGKLRSKEIEAQNIVVFVADEADTMIDQAGQGEQTIKIKNQLGRHGPCQILLFSATFTDKLRKFAEAVAPNATKIIIKREELSLEGVQQFFMDCRSESNKYEVLTRLYALLNIGQSIIFVHTVKTAKELTNKMRGHGYTVSLLHGKDMLPQERDRVMDDFKKGETTVLITTNVLARGIDILQVTLVINYDIPLKQGNRPDPETYIHRIGRSGRFGRKGVAINLIHDPKSHADLIAIADYFNKSINSLPEDPVALETIVKDALGRCK